jgi:hypothetical protein
MATRARQLHLAAQTHENGVIMHAIPEGCQCLFTRSRLYLAETAYMHIISMISPHPALLFRLSRSQACQDRRNGQHNPPNTTAIRSTGRRRPGRSPRDGEIIDEVRMIHSIEAIKRMDFDEGVPSSHYYSRRRHLQNYLSLLEKKVLRPVKPSKRSSYIPMHGPGIASFGSSATFRFATYFP